MLPCINLPQPLLVNDIVASMKFKEIHFDSPEYHQAWHLRQQVLRTPIGLQLNETDRREYAQNSHYGLFDGEALVACVSATRSDAQQVKLRQMAVEPGHQGLGIGARLVSSVEATLALRGVCKFLLHARIAAVGFYQKLGYSTCGEVFAKLGIDHISMHKELDEPLK